MALTEEYFCELVRQQNFLEQGQIDGSKALIHGQAYLFIEHYYQRFEPMIHYFAGYYQPGSYLGKNVLNCGGQFWNKEKKLCDLHRLTDVFVAYSTSKNNKRIRWLMSRSIGFVYIDEIRPAMYIYKLSDIPHVNQELPALFLQEYQERLVEPNTDTTKWIGKEFRQARDRFEQNAQQSSLNCFC